MKLPVLVFILLIMVFGILAFSQLESAACKDYNADCVNGGCAQFNYSQDCKLYCVDAVNPNKNLTIECQVPGSLGGGTVPTPGSP